MLNFSSSGVLKKIAVIILSVYLFIAIMASFIANDIPIYCVCDGKSQFPVFAKFIGLSSEHAWAQNKYANCNSKLLPLIPFHANTLDPTVDGYSSPGSVNKTRKVHILGTDALGKDVLAGLIHGTRYAFVIGLFSTVLSCFFGISIGIMAGYFGNNKLKLTFSQVIFCLFLLVLGIYYSTILYQYTENIFITIICIIIWVIVLIKLLPLFPIASKVKVPIDHLVMRIIEVFESLPKLLVLLLLMILFSRPGIGVLLVLIASLRWTLFAQIARGETMKISAQNFIKSAENIELSWKQIIVHHIWPAIKYPLFITAIFSFGSAVLLESTLSFLGIGLRLDQVSWGSILNEGRQFLPGWWLALFPGITIFIFLLAINWLFEDLKTQY